MSDVIRTSEQQHHPVLANTVKGHVVADTGLPAAGATIRAYHRGFGGATELLGQTQADGNGYYSIAYSARGATNLEMRVVDTQGKETVISEPKYAVTRQEAMNLVVPQEAHPVPPEFERVVTEVAKLAGGLDKLAVARETSELQDLTLLASATSWDARVVAVAASAASAATETGIPPEALYTMFRAGLPSDTDQLAMVGSSAVELALRAGTVAGIAGLNDDQIKQATAAYEQFSARKLQSAKPANAVSTYADLLVQSPLSAAEKESFARLYFADSQSGPDLWKTAERQGISATAIEALQLQGKLSFLTGNNAALVSALQHDLESGPTALVENDLYQPEMWKAKLNAVAASTSQSLDALIPPAYAGDTTPLRLEAYAADLARRVRVSYPTEVVARMVEKGDVSIGQSAAEHAPLRQFLRNAASLKFKLGSAPISTFVAANEATLFSGIAAADTAAVTSNVKTLQRLYQITPSNESLKTTADLGFRSAREIAGIPHDTYMERFSDKYPSLNEAELVYRKAHQVSSVTLSFFAAAKQMQSSPPVFGVSPSPSAIDESKNNLLKHYPTMESLFGSQDFCQCAECGSVLSPAAYFVDILQFLDPEPAAWNGFLGDWKTRHNNAPYPFQDQPAFTAFKTDWAAKHPGDPLPNTEKTPYSVLTERRPDLPNLELTCENTNTAMPYIDIVNEILEAYVAKGSLSENDVYNTGAATTPELLAEPQNIIPAAYDKLKAKYPLALPFDVWLETVRRFFQYFNVDFWQVLDLFRPADQLFSPLAAPEKYYRADIFAEQLGLSPAEYKLYTEDAGLAKWHELYGYSTEAAALAALPSAKTLARALSISYQDLADLVQTGFLNPRLNALVVLQKLEIDVATVFEYKKDPKYTPLTADEAAAFEAKLAALSAAYPGFDAKSWLDTAWTNGDFKQALVLASPSSGCDFSQTTLQYADGTAADAIVYLKLNLFVRLWRKLGGTVQEVDRALQAFIPANSLPLTTANIGPAMKSSLAYLAHLKQIDDQFPAGAGSRSKLLVLWSNLSTRGMNAVYPKLFLTPSILKTDPVFDDPLGNYLSKPGLVIESHLTAIQGALNLSASEVEAILADNKQDLTVALSISSLSLLYRYALLAKMLKLKVADVIALKQLSGLDPFRPIEADPIVKIEQDHPFNQTLEFIRVASAVTASGLAIDDLRYLLRHQFDPVGAYRQDDDALLLLVRTLSAGLRQIAREQAPPEDPNTLSDEILQQKLALAFPPDAVSILMGMWNGAVVREAVEPGVLPANQLDPKAFKDTPAIHVTYDSVRQAQHLTYRGFLSDARAVAQAAANPSPVFAAGLAEIQRQQQAFFDKYLSAFLTLYDQQKVFAPLDAGLTDKAVEAAMTDKRRRLANSFLPYLQKQLTRQAVVSSVAAALSADVALIETLLTDSKLLEDPSQAGATLLDAFAQAAQSGVDAVYYASTDGSGAPLSSAVASSADTSPKPAGANSAHFEGYLEIATPGAYRFFAALDKKNDSANLRVGGLPDPLVQGVAGADNTELSGFTELKAGIAYRFSFDAAVLGGGDARILAQGDGLPKDALGTATLYPQSVVERVRRGRVLLTKTLQLISTLGVGEREVRYLLSHSADFGGLSFSKLPTSDTGDPGTVLFQQFLRAAAYAKLKSEVAGGSDDLIGVFENARHVYPASAVAVKAEGAMLKDLTGRIADLSRRDVKAIQAIAKQFGMTVTSVVSGAELDVTAAAFTQEQGIGTLWAAMQLTEQLGVPIDALARWATPAPDDKTARDLRDTIKALYTTENWQKIAQSIFDKLRQKRRDALVAYITYQNGFDSADQLFEYFLIDPKMEPMVQTSRLRLAISAVQTFAQRCFMNLELEVRPAALNAKHWEWMRRYRVWDVHRRFFLFPEDWLDPAFRDDKTSLYSQFESALSQGDVSNDMAETAFFGYLTGLDEIAKIEILTIYAEQNNADLAENALHVIGRTSSLPHKYFYRRYQNRMWTPWQEISTQVEGEHLAAIVWRDRMQLFWLTFMDTPKQESTGSTKKLDINKLEVPTSAPDKDINVQLNWAEYFQGEWTARGSNGFGAPMTVRVENTFDSASAFTHATSKIENGVEVVTIHVHFDRAVGEDFIVSAVKRTFGAGIGTSNEGLVRSVGPSDLAFRVISRNSAPDIVTGEAPQDPPYVWSSRDKSRYKAFAPLRVTFVESIKTGGGAKPTITQSTKTLLQKQGYGASYGFSLTTAGQPPDVGGAGLGGLVTPFFYEDDRNAFYAEPTLTEVTIEEWDDWAVRIPSQTPVYQDPNWWNNLKLVPASPSYKPPIGGDPAARWDGSVDPAAKFQIQHRTDWLTHETTALEYGGALIGRDGGLGLTKLASAAAEQVGVQVVGRDGLVGALSGGAAAIKR